MKADAVTDKLVIAVNLQLGIADYDDPKPVFVDFLHRKQLKQSLPEATHI